MICAAEMYFGSMIVLWNRKSYESVMCFASEYNQSQTLQQRLGAELNLIH